VSAASIAGQINEQFDLTSYVPDDIQTDVATGAAYYESFNKAPQGVTLGPNGTIQISDAASQAVLQAMAATAAAAVPIAGPVFAGLLELYNVAPHASGGAGTCANPPRSNSPLDLTSWPNFTSWASFNGSYGPDAPGSFEAYANPILEYNWLLAQNCFPQAKLPPQVLLASLIASWNAKHAPSSTRVVQRVFDHITSFGANPNYDPIADALYNAIVAKYTHLPDNATFADLVNPANYNGPDQTTSSFTVNTGGLILTPITLRHLPTTADSMAALQKAGASAATAPSTAKRIAIIAAITLATGAAGIGVWALLTKQSYLGAARGVWKGSAGRLIAKVNPLPLTASESSKKTTVQTLLFPRPRFSPSRAKAWARSHNYAVHKEPDIKPNTVRIRQRDPGDFQKGSFRTISLGKSGVRAVVGRLR